MQTMVHDHQKRGSNNIDYNKVNFFDCLADFFKSSTLDVDNLRKCEYCHKENHSILQYRMKTRKLFQIFLFVTHIHFFRFFLIVPRILVIQMKRFD